MNKGVRGLENGTTFMDVICESSLSSSGVKANLNNKKFDWKSKTRKDFLSFIFYLGQS